MCDLTMYGRLSFTQEKLTKLHLDYVEGLPMSKKEKEKKKGSYIFKKKFAAHKEQKSEVCYLTNRTKIWTRPQNRLFALRQFRPLILEPWCGRWSFWKDIKRAAFQFKYEVHDNVPWPEHYFCALFLTFRPLLTTPLCYFFPF